MSTYKECLDALAEEAVIDVLQLERLLNDEGLAYPLTRIVSNLDQAVQEYSKAFPGISGGWALTEVLQAAHDLKRQLLCYAKSSDQIQERARVDAASGPDECDVARDRLIRQAEEMSA